MSPEEGADPEHRSTGGHLRPRPVIGSDGAAAPVSGGPAAPGGSAGSQWAWDGDALPVRAGAEGPTTARSPRSARTC
jgi:hypothetical protein